MIRKKYILKNQIGVKRETDIIGKIRQRELLEIPLLVRFQVRVKACCLWVDNERRERQSQSEIEGETMT